VIQNHKAGLVLYADKNDENNSNYASLVSMLAFKMSEYVNILIYHHDPEKEDPLLKREINSKKLPIFKLYKND